MNRGKNLEIAVLNQISQAVLREKDVSALLRWVLEILYREMGLLRGTVTLRRGDLLFIEASHGLSEEAKKRGRYRLGEGITGQVALSGRPRIIPDVSLEPEFLDRTGARGRDSHVAFICVPIIHLDEVIGTLSIDREMVDGADLERDFNLLEIVANLTAEAISLGLSEHEERSRLIEENERLKEELDRISGPSEIIGNCQAMRRVYTMIRQVASSSATVLIRGASGTGKELLARALQRSGDRRDKPFVVVNSAALPENLIESELFGHEKGAFTGAVNRRIGRVEAASSGTLFLDEIGDVGPQVQVKLLRFLQERTFQRVGGNEELSADVRIIAATSRNLEKLMEQGLFREDLYYRLNVFPIVLPDLAERRSDIPLLAEHFREKFSKLHPGGDEVQQTASPPGPAHFGAGHESDGRLCLARQYPGARKLHGARGTVGDGRHDPHFLPARRASGRPSGRAARAGVRGLHSPGRGVRARNARRGAEGAPRQCRRRRPLPEPDNSHHPL